MQFNANAFCIQYLGFDHLEEKENARATIYYICKDVRNVRKTLFLGELWSLPRVFISTHSN